MQLLNSYSYLHGHREKRHRKKKQQREDVVVYITYHSTDIQKKNTHIYIKQIYE